MLLNKYLEQLNKISSHQFMKIWQLKQFKISLQNLCKGQVLLVHGFSQNLLLYSQDEVTTAHWDHEQGTLHPTVVYYVGLCGKMIKEEVIHMTNNRKHIEKTVAVFQKKTIEFLKSKKVPIVEILEWTDNAPTQYKNKNCFQRMLLMQSRSPVIFSGKTSDTHAMQACRKYEKFVKDNPIASSRRNTLVQGQRINVNTQEPNQRPLCTHLPVQCFNPTVILHIATNTLGPQGEECESKEHSRKLLQNQIKEIRTPMSKQLPHQRSCQDVRMDPCYQKLPQYEEINHH